MPPTTWASVSYRTCGEVLSADDVRRALTRIAHEIVERNHGTDGVVLVGLATRRRVDRRRAGRILSVIGSPVPVGSARRQLPPRPTSACDRSCPATSPRSPSLDGTTVILVDDVLFTGLERCAPGWRLSTTTDDRTRWNWQ